MKRLSALLLAIVMMLTLLVACTDNDEPVDESSASEVVEEAKIEDAIKYLQAMYKETDGTATPDDYTVVGVVKISGTTFEVVWTTDSDEVKVKPSEDGKSVTIDVDEESDHELAYTLTATVKNKDGETASCSFKHTVPKFELISIADAIELEDGTPVVIKGTVVAIDTPWSEQYGNISVYVQDENGDKILCYRLATKVELGDQIVVKGEMGSYNGSKQIAAGATATITGHEDIVIDYKKMSVGEALAAEDGVAVELTGTITAITTPWSDSYGNITAYLTDASGKKILCYRLATKVEVGDKVIVKGYIGSYNGSKQLAQGATAEIIGHEDIVVNYTTMTIPQALAAEDGTAVQVSGTVCAIDAPWSDSYGNISVYIQDADGKKILCYRLATKVALGDKITVKGYIGAYNGVNQIAQGATAVITGHEDIVIEYKEMTIPQANAAEDGTLVSVKGTVASIGTPWSDNYGNISVTIKDEDGNTLYCYRLATKVELGDIIIVKGSMATYNEARQLGQGATAEIVGHEDVNTEYKEVTIPEALAAEEGSLVIFKGTVTAIDTPWSDQYNNISVYVEDADGNKILCHRLATKVEIGDKVTVKGTVTIYNGSHQIAAGATAEITGHEDITVEYPEMTTAEATAAADGTLASVTGIVTEVNGAWSDDYGNMNVTITDATGTFYCYRLATKVELGDQITVKGTIGSYNGAKQFTQGATAEIIGHYVEATAAEANAAADGTLVIVTGTVSEINTPWSDQYGNITVTITDDSGELYCYRLATNVEVGNVITVYGKVGSYNGSKQIAAGAFAIIVSTGEGGEDPEPTYTEMTIAEALASETGVLASVEGIVTEISYAWNGTNMSVYIEDASGNKIQCYKLESEVKLNDVITVKGEIGAYNSVNQMAAGSTAEITGSYVSATAAEALASEDGALVLVTATVSEINGEWNDSFKNMNVTVVDEAGTELYCYRLGTKVAVGDVLTIYGKVGSYNGSKQLAQGSFAKIVSSASSEYTSMTIAEALASETGVLASVEGIVTEVAYAWNGSNMSVYIEDASGNKIQCYKLASEVALYDVITVKGEIGAYNSVNQIAAGATAEVTDSYVEATAAEALASEDGALVIITATVTEVNGTWNDNYKNMNVTVVDEAGTELYCYRLGTKVEVGYVLTIYGKVGSYNGSKQLAQGSFAKILATELPDGEFTTENVTKPTGGTTADLSTLTSETEGSATSYKDREFTSGWTATNAAFVPKADGANETTNYITLNGKTSAPGSLASDGLTGGMKYLYFNYGFAFSDTKVKLIVNIKQNGEVVRTATLESTGLSKNTAYSALLTLNEAVEGDFEIEIVNGSLSGSSSNKDRVSIWDITWAN